MKVKALKLLTVHQKENIPFPGGIPTRFLDAFNPVAWALRTFHQIPEFSGIPAGVSSSSMSKSFFTDPQDSVYFCSSSWYASILPRRSLLSAWWVSPGQTVYSGQGYFPGFLQLHQVGCRHGLSLSHAVRHFKDGMLLEQLTMEFVVFQFFPYQLILQVIFNNGGCSCKQFFLTYCLEHFLCAST